MPPRFGPPIQVRRGGLWAKHMGLTWGAIGNTLGEHIGNLNGTCWEQRKNIPPYPKLKRKKNHLALWVHVKPPHWLHKISIFQNYSSPFLAWANTPIINWGFYYYYYYYYFLFFFWSPPLFPFLLAFFPFPYVGNEQNLTQFCNTSF